MHLESTKGITCYVNSTNRCTCSCTFCLRQTKEMIENNSLWLKEEPTVDEIIQEFEKYNLNDFKEVVFCGFGEPLIRHDDLMKVAKYLKEEDLITYRVNTNGLSSLYNKEILRLNLKDC
ncbi:MAG: radical SAM protein [Faecalibacillus faecis]